MSNVQAEDAIKTLDGLGEERVHSSWEVTEQFYVVNHLSAEALRKYVIAMARAFCRVCFAIHEKAASFGQTCTLVDLSRALSCPT